MGLLAHSLCSLPRGTVEIPEYVFTLRTQLTGINAIVVVIRNTPLDIQFHFLGSKGDVFLDSFARKAAVDQLTLEEKLDIMKGLSPDALLKPGSVDTEEYLIFQKVSGRRRPF